MAAHSGAGRFVPSVKVRAYVYAVMIAAGPLVTFYGLASREEFALWAGFGATVLAPGGVLALANLTPKGTPNGGN